MRPTASRKHDRRRRPVDGSPGSATQIIAGTLLGRLVSQRIAVLRTTITADDLADLVALLDDGTLRVPVERTFGFADVPAAMAHGESRRTSGKVVVTR